MSNIEEDIKILNNLKGYLNKLIYEGQHKIFYNDLGYDEKTIDCINALEHILAERKQDKARIKELEEALLKVKDKNTTLFITCRNSIPKQKVKDKIERHEFAKKDFEKEYDNKHYEDDEIRARDFYMIVAEDLIIKNLKDLLEDK